MDISFKTVQKHEIPALSELASEIWHEFFPCLLSAEQINYMVDKFQSEHAMQKQMADENYTYYFINVDGQNAGYFGIADKEEYLFLSKLYLKKDHRHKGFGSLAFNKIKSIAKERGYSKIRLTVNKYNTNTIKAYNKYGFKTIASDETDIGNGFIMDDYIMEFSL